MRNVPKFEITTFSPFIRTDRQPTLDDQPSLMIGRELLGASLADAARRVRLHPRR